MLSANNVTIIPSYEKVSNAINIEDNKNTKEIIIEVENAKAVVYEDKVVFTITPEDGYEIDSIEIIDENNNIIEYRKTSKENEYEFIMPETNVVIKPIYKKIESYVPNNPYTGNRFLLFFYYYK